MRSSVLTTICVVDLAFGVVVAAGVVVTGGRG